MEVVVAAGIFLGVVLVIEALYYLFNAARKPEERRVRRRLKSLSEGVYGQEEISILRKTILSSIPWLDRFLFKVPNILRVSGLLEKADARYPLGFYLLLSALLAPVGYLAGGLLKATLPLKVLLSGICLSAPFFWLYIKKIKRMQMFEKQLPDALDMIARAMKAGHAFPGGLSMASEELDDPVATELGKTLDEVNFGISIPDALKNLAVRVDCPDLKFFVVAVIIQRDTGGNLAEIIENLAYLIRERFKLQGRVKILAAEGKFSALVLILVPFFVAFYFYIVQPKYLMLLFKDPIGRVMVTMALIMMFIGTIIMRQMVRIRV